MAEADIDLSALIKALSLGCKRACLRNLQAAVIMMRTQEIQRPVQDLKLRPRKVLNGH